MIIKLQDEPRYRCMSDLIAIYRSDTYTNIKGYLQKLVDLLYKLGYYEDNESLFPEGKL